MAHRPAALDCLLCSRPRPTPFFGVVVALPQSALVEYNAALHSIGFMIFLGFADDVVDLPWRYKLILPTIATLPLLVAYSGSTWIAVPWPFVSILGSSINLGILYQVRVLPFPPHQPVLARSAAPCDACSPQRNPLHELMPPVLGAHDASRRGRSNSWMGICPGAVAN